MLLAQFLLLSLCADATPTHDEVHQGDLLLRGEVPTVETLPRRENRPAQEN